MTQNKTKDSKRLLIELAFVTFSGIYAVITVLTCWRMPALASLVLFIGLWMQLFFWREKEDAATMMFAALIGAPSEMLCVKLGLWSYYAPGLILGVPAWLPLVWAFLMCLFRRFSLTVHAILHKRWPGSVSACISLLFWMLGVLIIIYFIITVSIIKKEYAVIFSFFMIITVMFKHSRKDILIFITGAVFGTLGEYLCMRLGFWLYHNPHFKLIGLPISLPLAWGLSSVIITTIAMITTNKRKSLS